MTHKVGCQCCNVIPKLGEANNCLLPALIKQCCFHFLELLITFEIQDIKFEKKKKKKKKENDRSDYQIFILGKTNLRISRYQRLEKLISQNIQNIDILDSL
jgi:hypothetical protein